MLRLTKRTEYGLIALVHMAELAEARPADAEAEVISARAIGDIFPVPKRMLAEALKHLQQGGILESTRGVRGGYRLSRPADQISLGEIVSALEGPPTLTSCAGMGAASSNGGTQWYCMTKGGPSSGGARSPPARSRSGWCASRAARSASSCS